MTGSIPNSFLAQFIRKTILPTRDTILETIRDPERFADAIKSRADINPNFIDNVDRFVHDIGMLARENLANIVGATPDAHLVAKQLEGLYRKVNGHPDASFYLSRLAISE